MSSLSHAYPFDPTHGHSLEDLLRIPVPEEPPDFEAFWRKRYAAALGRTTAPRLRDTGTDRGGWRVFDIDYTSTDATTIRGWLLLPVSGVIRRGFVIGHGYGGRETPDFDLPLEEAALLFFCARGLGRSWNPYISSQPQWHVIHDIQSRHRYVLGGCVEDVWTAASTLLRLFPQVAGHLGYGGTSFGGGLGALALAWDSRFQRAHFCVPTFGNQPLRLQLPSTGSAASVQAHGKKHPGIAQVLPFYDAAVAARHIRIPVLCACATFDPAVAPAGQFSIYNALSGPRDLFVLTAGHHPHPQEVAEAEALRHKIHDFFRDI